MRLSQIHIYQHNLVIAGPAYRMSLSEVSALDSTIVKIVTDTGVTGFGEVCPVGSTYQDQHAAGARAALIEMSPHLIGENPLHIDTVGRKMDAALRGHGYAKAAIDMAMWDIAGKAHGMRVCDLLGGALRESVPSYYAVGPESPDEAARIAKDKQEQGFPRIQIKVGGRDYETDVESIHKVNAALNPGTRLAVDANRGWTTRDTIAVSQACRDITFVIEQPCETFEELVSLRGKLCHPLYMDETATDVNAVLRCVNENIVEGFGLKLTRVGGISAMRTIRDICNARNFCHTCDDDWGGDIIAAACTHVGATVATHLLEGVWIADPYLGGHYDEEGGIKIKNGWINLPDQPGLGINPDVDKFGDPVASFS